MSLDKPLLPCENLSLKKKISHEPGFWAFDLVCKNWTAILAGSRCAGRLTVRKRAAERTAVGFLKVTVEMCLDEAREGMGEEASQQSRWSHGEVNINDVMQGLASLPSPADSL